VFCWIDKINVTLYLDDLVMANSIYEQVLYDVTEKHCNMTKCLAVLFKKSLNLDLSLGPNFSDSFCMVSPTPPNKYSIMPWNGQHVSFSTTFPAPLSQLSYCRWYLFSTSALLLIQKWSRSWVVGFWFHVGSLDLLCAFGTLKSIEFYRLMVDRGRLEYTENTYFQGGLQKFFFQTRRSRVNRLLGNEKYKNKHTVSPLANAYS
jgi:hypothetical protein